LTSFLSEYGVVVALVCAGAAVAYGLLITKQLLAKSPGNERMQEISGAVQEGAQAYLTRQYTIIAGVAIPSFAPVRTTYPLRWSISVLLPRARSCAVDEN